MGILETIKNKSYPIIYRVIDKCLSARFIIAIAVAITLCRAVDNSFSLVMDDTSDKELWQFSKEIFMYVMGVFSGIVGTVIASYFTRQDRMKDHSNGDLNK